MTFCSRVVPRIGRALLTIQRNCFGEHLCQFKAERMKTMIKDLASGKSFQLGLTLFSACISMSTCWFFIVQWPANSLASKCRSASESCAEDVQSQHKKKSSQSWMRQGDTDRYSLIGTSSFVQIVLSFCLFASTTW